MYLFSNLNAFLDCEWDSDGNVICCQIGLTHGEKSRYSYSRSTYLVFNEKYRDFLASKGYVEGCLVELKTHLLFTRFSDQWDMLTNLIYNHFIQFGIPFNKKRMNCNLYLFFSLKDLKF